MAPTKLRSAALLALFCAPAARVAEGRREGQVAPHGSREDLALLSDGRTLARFAAAFPELNASAWSTCPFGDEAASLQGGETSFHCHWRSEGQGKTCPGLQAARLKAAHRFQIANYQSFIDRAANFELKPLFDKSKKLVGDESYEALDYLQIQGLSHESVKEVEDKILLKALAERLGVPTTEMIYGAHESEWDEGSFRKAITKLCADGVDGFMIKATHMSWSAGMKIVRGWQKVCQGHEESVAAELDKLVAFVRSDVFGKKTRAADRHLWALEPGLTVEELFQSGGHSLVPLEAKVQTLWGKVHHIFFTGVDPRGCRSQSGAWQVYGDMTGWDLKGMIGTSAGNDEFGDRILNKAFDRLVELSEKFAQGVGADLIRVDFFLGLPEEGDDGEIVIKMNECESVSGSPNWHDRQTLGSIWRDGYILSDRLSMSPEKWQTIYDNTEKDRAVYSLD